MLNVVMLNVVVLNGVMLNVVILIVVMQNVSAPLKCPASIHKTSYGHFHGRGALTKKGKLYKDLITIKVRHP